MFVVVVQLWSQKKVGGWNNKLLVIIYDYNIIDMIQGGWLASTRGGFPALLRQRSDPQQVSIFCCNFEVIKIHPQNVNILLKKNKCDDKDVGQGGYVGENRDPDYRRYEQASHLDIMITYYHYYYHILWAGEPDRYQPYHLLHHQSQDFSSALALRFHILDIWKSLWNCDHNNCDCESTGQWGNSGGNFTSSWAGSVAQNCL